MLPDLRQPVPGDLLLDITESVFLLIDCKVFHSFETSHKVTWLRQDGSLLRETITSFLWDTYKQRLIGPESDDA